MIPDPDQYDQDEIQFGFHVETDPDELDVFDAAEEWLAAQDVPDPSVWPNGPDRECLDERWLWS